MNAFCQILYHQKMSQMLSLRIVPNVVSVRVATQIDIQLLKIAALQ